MSWSLVPLGSIATLARDGVAPERISSGTLFVGLENIKKGGEFEGIKPVESGEIASTKFSFTPEHVLYGKLRPYLAKIALPNFKGVCSTDIIPILPGPKLDRRYLAHYLLTPGMLALASDRATGANLPRLSPNALLDFPVPLPPLDEQRRIAAILDKAGELVAKRRQALALLDQLTQAIFLDMFGDPEKNTKNLPTSLLSELCVRITDGTHLPPKFSSTGHPFLFVRNIVGGEIDFNTEKFISEETYQELTRRCPIELGDVIYSTVGSYGVPVVVRSTRRFAFQRHIAHIKTDRAKLLPEFLCGMLASPPLRRQADFAARGIAQKTINLADIRKYLVFAPPLDLQRCFASQVESIHRIKSIHQSALGFAEALFASLQFKAFSGDPS